MVNSILVISHILILRMGKPKVLIKYLLKLSDLYPKLSCYFFSCNTLAVLVLVITGLLLITVTILGLLLGGVPAEMKGGGSSDFRFRFAPVGVATTP